MGLAEILALMFVVCVGALVWRNLEAREIANAAIREACGARGFLFLNDTVALESLWPARDNDGRLRLRRVYSFEFSDTGHDRRRGIVTLIGNTIAAVDIGAPTAGLL